MWKTIIRLYNVLTMS